MGFNSRNNFTTNIQHGKTWFKVARLPMYSSVLWHTSERNGLLKKKKCIKGTWHYPSVMTFWLKRKYETCMNELFTVRALRCI